MYGWMSLCNSNLTHLNPLSHFCHLSSPFATFTYRLSNGLLALAQAQTLPLASLNISPMNTAPIPHPSQISTHNQSSLSNFMCTPKIPNKEGVSLVFNPGNTV